MNKATSEKEPARREADRMIEAYLDRMCAKIKAKELHPELREEMRGHIEELIADREEEERSPQQAAAWALEQMGDADEVGSTLGRVHKPKFDWRLLLPIAVMAGLGLLALFSLSAAGEGAAQRFDFGLNQIFYYVLGAIALAIFVFADYRLLRKYAVQLYAVTAVLTVLFFSFRSVSMNGTQSWIIIGPLTLNWTLCMFILFLSTLPGLFERLRVKEAEWNGISNLLAIGAILLPVVLYVYFDLIAWLPLLAYGIAAFAMYARCGGSRLYLIAAPVAAIGWAGSLYLRSPVWRDRVGSVFAPQHQSPDNLYLNENMAAAIREGGWLGQGFGASGSSVVYPYNDAILPYLTYSFGWTAAALLIGSIVWLIALLLRSAKLISDKNGSLLVMGLSVFLAGQWVYGVGASFGWLPFTTLAMPFIGYGGTSTIVYCAVIGLILGIYRRKDTIPASGEKFAVKPSEEKKLLL
ncbi:FtsW/RodA/SpoVE family cell cycle protein [Saccharibacillus sp. O23]|uniref:FtsW/RodA/SpoVE family cell cycle protein n=1 Tax=Saccharibacillus sp. O23 TaxID=2009338 RepID=UPI0015C58AB2|nr:FtsW/RodA/SpoVE family cell cycle protein [Saccharibacillus sp. O23]